MYWGGWDPSVTRLVCFSVATPSHFLEPPWELQSPEKYNIFNTKTSLLMHTHYIFMKWLQQQLYKIM